VEELVIPHGASVIPGLFEYCASLKKVVIGDVNAPAENPNPNYFVGDLAFAYCLNLNQLEIAAHYISPAAYHNTYMTKLIFSNTPVQWVENQYEWCGYADEVHIPAGKIPGTITPFSTKKLFLGEEFTELNCYVAEVEEVYMYRYAPDCTILSPSFINSKRGRTYHVPKGCIEDAPEGAPYTGGYNYIQKDSEKYNDPIIIDDLPNPLYAGIEEVTPAEESALDHVTVYTLGGIVYYEGLRGDTALSFKAHYSHEVKSRHMSKPRQGRGCL